MSSLPPPIPHTPAAAYDDTEQGRALLQTRLARYAKFTTFVSAGFFPLGLMSRAIVGTSGEKGWAGVLSIPSFTHLSGILIFAAGWWFVERRKRSEIALRLTDLTMTVGGSISWELMGIGAPSWARADQFTTFVVALLLAIRAVLIPCTVRGSRVITSAAVAPISAITFYHFSTHPLPDGPSPLGLTLNAALNSVLIVVVITLVSNTVHGLRQRVRQALKLGQYTLDEKIGEGGMGVVYRASHALLRRPTAIKLLPPERAGEHNLVRFEREVQLTSMLTHPNTISIYDFGRTPEGTFYYAMEYLEGLDLETLVGADGPQDAGRVVHLLVQVCGALSEAHSVGLIHRDVKPANIILCERGGTPDVVKVLDFGLVKQLGPEQQASPQTSLVNQIVGTPLYLSPEAIARPSEVDARSDLYALGAVGYTLLTGGPPFTGESVVEVCGHHLHTPPTPPSERAPHPVPGDLEAVILQCLAKAADDRPQSAAALRKLLLACDSASSWTPEGASAWWSERGKALIAAGVRPRPSTKGGSPSVILTRAVVGAD